MKFRSSALPLFFCFFIYGIHAQVRVERHVNGKIKNKDILIQAAGKNEILVEQFTLFFRTQHTMEEPSMGAILKVGLDLDPKLAVEIATDAYAYFKEAFANKGYTVREIEKETFKNNLTVSKADKNGEKWLLNDTAVVVQRKKSDEDPYLAAHAKGVNHCPIIKRSVIGTFDAKEASTVAFLEVINFADPLSKMRRGKYLGSPIINPGLVLDSAETICGTGGFGFWNAKLKGGSVSFPINPEIKWDGAAWLADTKNLEEPNTQLWHVNREEFKKAVLELSKANINSYIEEYIKAITP